jgi:hypothetical protein
MAVAAAAPRAPAAIGDPAVVRCWRVPGAGGGRPAAGACLGVVLAAAVPRAPAAIGDPAVVRCWRVPGAGGGRPAAGARLGVVLASAGNAARRRRVHGSRR